MSRREDNVSCIDVTIMDRFAHSAVLTEITRTQFKVTETIAVPERQPTSREVDLSAAIANCSDLKGNPAEGPACTTTLAPGQPNFLMLPAPSRVFFRDLLHRLDRKMQGTVTARSAFSVLVLHPQAQDPNGGTSRTGHLYSLPKFYPITPWQTSRNAHRGTDARVRVSLSLGGLKAGVSRGEIG
jgi:hypothetical protein